jgi:hypothetical protein
MPWMPEVFTAPIAEARRSQRAMTINDAVPYYEGIMADEPDALVRFFAAQQLVLDDPASATWRSRRSYTPSSPGWRTGCTSETRCWRTWP